MCLCREVDSTGSMVEWLSAATRALQRALAEGAIAEIPCDALQNLLAAAVRVYAAKLEAEGPFAPFPPDHTVTATEVVRTVTEMLDAVQVEVFELGMWQAWTKPRKGG